MRGQRDLERVGRSLSECETEQDCERHQAGHARLEPGTIQKRQQPMTAVPPCSV
jgi:hypothetical protein